MPRAFHEDLSRHERAEAGSPRGVGIVFAAVFAIVGLWPLLGGEGPRAWALAGAAGFAAVAWWRPGWLAPLNRAWMALGRALHRVTTPVVMGLIFFATVVPTGLVLRLLGKDPLRLRLDPGAETYWIERRPPGPEPETMRRQF